MVAHREYDGSLMEPTFSQKAAPETKDRGNYSRHLERGNRSNETEIFESCEHHSERPMEKLGASKSAQLELSVEGTIAGLNLRSLRICDTVRLLNSTPLGEVISERQLYRHRTRSCGQFMAGPRRIDFFKYIAWVRAQVERRRQKHRNQPEYLRQIRKGPRISVSVNDIMGLLERQNFRCALTGRKLLPTSASLDHIHPVSRDGESSIDNAQVLDSAVNRAKNTMTNDEFIAMCRQVVRHADR